MNPAIRTATLLLCLTAFPLSLRAEGIYRCQEGRGETKKVWYTNQVPRGARCKLVLQGDGDSRVSRGADTSASSRPASPARNPRTDDRWEPPKTAARQAPQVAPPVSPGADSREAPSKVDEIIALAAKTYNIPEDFIRAEIHVESAFNPKALSRVGAMGLMQLMPGTARDMGVTDPWDPYQNIMGGTRFLRHLADRFGGDMVKVISAYHAGGGVTNMKDGTPWQGTDAYVRRVLRHYYKLKHERENSAGNAAVPLESPSGP